MPTELIKRIQEYVALTSIDITVLRGSPKGSVKAAAEFCAGLDLGKFGIKRKSLFCQRLDGLTEALEALLPGGGPSWGTARKVLNIFLHNAFYNHYLRQQFRLSDAEQLFEVPIDHAVSKGLKRAVKQLEGYTHHRRLPAWGGVKHLTPDQNRKYQEAALLVAENLGVTRVHLDVLLWIENR